MSSRPVKLGFATADWGDDGTMWFPGGSGYYRASQPAAECGAPVGRLLGIDGTFAIGDMNSSQVHAPDVVVIHRYWGPTLAQAVRAARKLGQVVVADLDDDYWALHNSNKAKATISPEQLRWHRNLLRACDWVMVSTYGLAHRVETLGVKRSAIRLRPNRVDLAMFKDAGGYREKSEGQADVRVGWIGATQWRSGDLEVLDGVMYDVLDRTGASFYHGGHVSGAAMAHELLGLRGMDGNRLLVNPLVPISQYPRLFKPLHVGMVPLSDHEFNRSKSYIKGLEYAASGIPFVHSPSVEYSSLNLGTEARSALEWSITLCDLLKDRAYWLDQRERGLEVVRGYSTRGLALAYENLVPRAAS